MTAPPLAEAHGDRGRYYRHPTDPDCRPYVSVTNVASSLRDKQAMEALMGWGVKVTAEYWRDHLPQAVAASMDPAALEEFVKRSKDERNHVSERASLLGSMIHARAEAHVLGTETDLAAFARGHQLVDSDGELDIDGARDLYDDSEDEVKSYLKCLTDFDIDLTKHVEASECTVASNTFGYAGTLDLLVWLPIDPETGDWDPTGRRHLWLVDVKSSRTQPRTRIYPGAVLQLAGLRWAEEVWLPDQVAAMPTPITGAAILNVRREKWLVCECGKQLKPGGGAASHQRSKGHDVDTDYRELYGFVPLSAYTGGEAHAAFVSAVTSVRWLHDWVDAPTPKPLEASSKPAIRAVTNGAELPRSATERHDPLALAATTSPSKEIGF